MWNIAKLRGQNIQKQYRLLDNLPCSNINPREREENSLELS